MGTSTEDNNNQSSRQPVHEFLTELAIKLESGLLTANDAIAIAHACREYAWVELNRQKYNELTCEECKVGKEKITTGNDTNAKTSTKPRRKNLGYKTFKMPRSYTPQAVI
jgi:hypothetical protein